MAVSDAQTTELTVADDVLGRDNSVCSTGVWVSERTKRDEIVVHWIRAVIVTGPESHCRLDQSSHCTLDQSSPGAEQSL